MFVEQVVIRFNNTEPYAKRIFSVSQEYHVLLCCIVVSVLVLMQLLRRYKDFTKKETVLKVQRCLQSIDGDADKNMQLRYSH